MAVAVLAALVVAGGAGLFLYGTARGDHVAKGVRIGGVDVGGLSEAAARAKLRTQLLAALEQPIRIHHDTRTWTLGPREAKVSADLDQMVDEAIARSREGNALSRGWRSLTGGRLEADLQPTVTFSDAAVIRLIDRVRKAVERKPVDASVRFTAAGLARTPSRDGLAIQASELHRQIRAALVQPAATRRFVAHTHHSKPKVTTDALAAKYASALIVNRKTFRLTLYKNLERAEVYKIAVGRIGLETPAGLYTIQNKAKNPAWHVPDSEWAGDLAGKVIPADDPKNPIKARWMGIYDGAGIHGTDAEDSIGTAASHGCIRMRVRDVEKLYDEVPVGTPVYIA